MSQPIDYQVVYDLASHGYTAWRYAFIPLGVAIAVYALRPFYQRYRFVITIIIVAATLASVWILIVTWYDYSTLHQIVAAGRFRTVVGTVTDFTPEGRDGHPSESFRIDTVTYTYSSYYLTPDFHQTMREGGPIRAGLRVRVGDVGHRIVRLEIAR